MQPRLLWFSYLSEQDVAKIICENERKKDFDTRQMKIKAADEMLTELDGQTVTTQP